MKTVSLLILLFVAAATRGSEGRQGKIFDANFWNGFEQGLKDTAKVISRVSENLELVMDQITGDFSNNFQQRVDINPLFNPNYNPEFAPNSPIQAISGNLDGIDPGLQVYYEGKNGEIESATVDTSKYPEAEAGQRFPEVFSPFRNQHFGMQFGGSFFRPFANFSPFASRPGGTNIFDMMDRRRQWWKGPNVCVDREEIDESDNDDADDADEEALDRNDEQDSSETSPVRGPFFGFGQISFSSCKESETSYSCVTKTSQRGVSKSVTVSYRCCHGFVRDDTGCMRVQLVDLPRAIESVDANDFLTLLKAARLDDLLMTNNLTIFAPTNEAIMEHTQDLEETNELGNNIDGYRSLNEVTLHNERHNLEPTLLSHITNGFVYAAQFVDEEVLPSENPYSSIRINTYSNYPPTVTVNCARIVIANQHATNGVIHTIDRVLTPVSQNVAEIISSDPKFSIFKELLSKSGLMEGLQDATQQTVFAPTNEAFEKLPNSTLDGILSGNACQEAVLLSHLLPNTICSAAIHDKARTMNHLKKYLNLRRDENDDLFVAKAKILERDIVGTNGVIHVIDGVLVPKEAKSAVELLAFHGLSSFLDLLEEAEMKEELDKMSGITIFAPSNEALENAPEGFLENLKEDNAKLKEFLLYHITISSILGQDMRNNHIANMQAELPLRINLNSRIPILSDLMRNTGRSAFRMTAGCSRVSLSDSKGCGVIVHIIDKILQLPAESVYQQLQNDEELSIFAKMVKDVELEKDLQLSGPYTILAPSDHALRAMPKQELDEILHDDELKKQVVTKHILYEHICCSGINHNSWLFMDRKRAMDSSSIHVRRTHNGRLMAGPARIVKCGSPAQNGLVHTINRLLADVDNRKSIPIVNRQFAMPKLGLNFFGL